MLFRSSMLSGLDVPDTGQVLAFGQDVYALPDGQRTRFLRERVGFVFQDYNLVPYLTVKGFSLRFATYFLTDRRIFLLLINAM